MVLKVLTGTPAGEIPVEILRDNAIVINGNTARAIGVDISKYGPNDADIVSALS